MKLTIQAWTANILLSVMVYAQPQYRVVVDLPIVVTGIPSGTTVTNVTLCFREVDRTDIDFNHCPLGTTTFPFPGPNERQTLELGPGSDSLPPTYEFQSGINPPRYDGMLLLSRLDGTVGGNPTVLATTNSVYRRGPGVLGNAGNLAINGGGLYQVTPGVECLPQFTGSNCEILIPTTVTTAESSTTAVTMVDITTEVLTETITTAETATQATTERESTANTESTSTETMTQSITSSSMEATDFLISTAANTESTFTETMTQSITQSTSDSMEATDFLTSTAAVPPVSTMKSNGGSGNTGGSKSNIVIAAGAGAGGGVAVLLLLVILLVILLVCMKRKKRKGIEREVKDHNLSPTSNGNKSELPFYTVVDKSKKKPRNDKLLKLAEEDDPLYSDVTNEEVPPPMPPPYLQEGNIYSQVTQENSQIAVDQPANGTTPVGGTESAVQEDAYNVLSHDFKSAKKIGQKGAESDLPTYSSLGQPHTHNLPPPSSNKETPCTIYYNNIARTHENPDDDGIYNLPDSGTGKSSDPNAVYYNTTSTTSKQEDVHGVLYADISVNTQLQSY